LDEDGDVHLALTLYVGKPLSAVFGRLSSGSLGMAHLLKRKKAPQPFLTVFGPFGFIVNLLAHSCHVGVTLAESVAWTELDIIWPILLGGGTQAKPGGHQCMIALFA
jgi:hypothetical protein